MTNADPYNLDKTEFAEFLQQINDILLSDDDDTPDEPVHPLRNNRAVVALCDYLQQTKSQLFKARKPNGGMSDDAYFEFNEGLMLRPEVMAKLVLDYIKQHPEIITEQ